MAICLSPELADRDFLFAAIACWTAGAILLALVIIFRKELAGSVKIIELSFQFVSENPLVALLSTATLLTKVFFILLEVAGLLVVLNAAEQKFNPNFFLADLVLSGP